MTTGQWRGGIYERRKCLALPLGPRQPCPVRSGSRWLIEVGPMAKKASANKPAKPYQVFVSHATADKWLAKTKCGRIEDTGASTFRDDRDISGGDDIPEEIRRQIKQSKEIVVLLTPESVNRQWVILEVGAAWGWSKRMRITLIRYHVSVDPIPDMIKNKKAISLNDFDDYTSDLAKRVGDHYAKQQQDL